MLELELFQIAEYKSDVKIQNSKINIIQTEAIKCQYLTNYQIFLLILSEKKMYRVDYD